MEYGPLAMTFLAVGFNQRTGNARSRTADAFGVGFEPAQTFLGENHLLGHVETDHHDGNPGIEDYGRGINWEGVKSAAVKLGLPTATEDDLLHAMFASGISTKGEVTTVSGRGVGLAAVHQQVDDLGGQIAVISKPKQGTCFRFTFPLPKVGPRFGVETVEEAA